MSAGQETLVGMVADDAKSPERHENEVVTELRLLLADAKAANVQGALEEFSGYLKEAAKPDRGQLEQIQGGGSPAPDRQPAMSIKVSLATDALYRRLPEDVKKIRTPDTDHWSWYWMKGLRHKNWGAMRLAEDELCKIGQGYSRVEIRELERAALAEGTPDATSGIGGGTAAPLIPLPLANLIIRARDAAGRLRAIVTPFSTDAQTLRVPTSGVATAAMVSEGAGGSDNEPTPGSALLAPKKMQSKMVVSDETLEDSPFNVVGYLAERAGSAMGALEDVQMATSNGTPPNFTGSFDANTSIAHLTEATPGTLTYADLVELFFLLPTQYHTAFTYWFAGSAMLILLSQMVDAVAGRPIFAPLTEGVNVVTDMPGNIGIMLGRPVLQVPVAGDNLYIGDLRHYGLCDKGGIRAAASEHITFNTDQVTFKFTQRVDGTVLLAEAFKSVEGITAIG